jgi:hypothetical protein
MKPYVLFTHEVFMQKAYQYIRLCLPAYYTTFIRVMWIVKIYPQFKALK